MEGEGVSGGDCFEGGGERGLGRGGDYPEGHGKHGRHADKRRRYTGVETPGEALACDGSSDDVQRAVVDAFFSRLQADFD